MKRWSRKRKYIYSFQKNYYSLIVQSRFCYVCKHFSTSATVLIKSTSVIIVPSSHFIFSQSKKRGNEAHLVIPNAPGLDLIRPHLARTTDASDDNVHPKWGDKNPSFSLHSHFRKLRRKKQNRPLFFSSLLEGNFRNVYIFFAIFFFCQKLKIT